MIFQQLSDLKIEPFKIDIIFKEKRYLLQVTQSRLSDQIEEFTASLNNKSIIITTNRPWIKLKEPRKKVVWKIIKPELKVMIDTGTTKLIEEVLMSIKSHVAKIEQPPFDWSTHPKNNPH